MAVATTESFFEALAKSELLTEAQIADARRDSGETDDPKAAARKLVKSGLLTTWQASSLLGGDTNLKLGKYTLLEKIGSEEIGVVYLAEHVQMGRRVVIKTLNNKHTNNSKAVQRFLAEAQRVAALHHRNIIHLFDVSCERDRYYIVLEHAEGRDFQSLVAADGPLAREVVADYLLQTAEGLSHAHGKSLFHGDVKPENLLLDAQGLVKIVNFGVARLVEHSGQNADASTDLAALGEVGTFLLTGKTGLGERTSAPPGIESICLKLASKNPAEKFQSADEAAAAIKKWLAEQRSAGPEVAPKIQRTATAAAPAAKSPAPKHKPPALAKRAPKIAEPFAEPLTEPLASASGGFNFVIDRNAKAAVAELPKIQVATAKPTAKVPVAKVPAAQVPAAQVPAAQVEAEDETDADAASPAEKRGLSPTLLIGTGAGAAILAMLAVGLLLFFFWNRGEKEVASADKEKDKKVEVKPADDEKSANPATTDPPGQKPKIAVEVSKPEPPKPVEPPTPEPMPVAPPVEPVKPEPPVAPPVTPVEPPKVPAPPPTPAPASNPFRDLGEAVDLPALGTPDKPEEAKTPVALGSLHVQPKDPLTIDLAGGNKAIKGKQSFSIKAAPGGAVDRDWEVSFNPAGEAGADSQVVALLSVKDDKLNFQWTDKALADPLANHLRNCALVARTGSFTHPLAFRKPIEATPITVSFSKAMKGDASLDFLPAPEAVEVEITSLEGSKVTFDPKATFEAVKGTTNVLIGSDKGASLRLKVNCILTKKVVLNVAPYFKLAVMPNEDKYTTQNMIKWGPKAVGGRQQFLQGDLDRISKIKDATQQQQLAPLRINHEQELKLIDTTFKQFDEIKSNQDDLNNKGKIHFRVYYVAGDQQVDLVRTSSAAPQPAK